MKLKQLATYQQKNVARAVAYRTFAAEISFVKQAVQATSDLHIAQFPKSTALERHFDRIAPFNTPEDFDGDELNSFDPDFQKYKPMDLEACLTARFAIHNEAALEDEFFHRKHMLNNNNKKDQNKIPKV